MAPSAVNEVMLMRIVPVIEVAAPIFMEAEKAFKFANEQFHPSHQSKKITTRKVKKAPIVAPADINIKTISQVIRLYAFL